MDNLFFLLSILCSSLLLNIFRFFSHFKVNTLPAIVVNYAVAASLSFTINGAGFELQTFLAAPWNSITVILGLLFITLFNLMAYCSNHLGVTSTSIANKVTFIFPALIGILFYNESSSFIKTTGLILAIGAVLLSGGKLDTSGHRKDFLLLILLFVGGGLLDSLLNHSQRELIEPGNTAYFFGHLFLFAFLFGGAFLIYQLVKKQSKINLKDIIWGIILGVPNFGSLYFFLRSLETIPTSIAFPVANMGVILGSTFLSVLIFKERLTQKKMIALSCAIIAIVLIAF